MHSVSLRFEGKRNNQKKKVEKNMKERLVKELDENNTVVSYKWKSEVQKKYIKKKHIWRRCHAHVVRLLYSPFTNICKNKIKIK